MTQVTAPVSQRDEIILERPVNKYCISRTEGIWSKGLKVRNQALSHSTVVHTVKPGDVIFLESIIERPLPHYRGPKVETWWKLQYFDRVLGCVCSGFASSKGLLAYIEAQPSLFNLGWSNRLHRALLLTKNKWEFTTLVARASMAAAKRAQRVQSQAATGLTTPSVAPQDQECVYGIPVEMIQLGGNPVECVDNMLARNEAIIEALSLDHVIARNTYAFSAKMHKVHAELLRMFRLFRKSA
jgi:hypothetical protein